MGLVAGPLPLSINKAGATAAPLFFTTGISTSTDGLSIRNFNNAAGNSAGGSLGGTKPAVTSFAVLADGQRIAVASVEYGPACQAACYMMDLKLASKIEHGSVITVSYAAPTPDAATTNEAIQSPTGADAASFGPLSVTNRVPAPTTPNTPEVPTVDAGEGSTGNTASWDAEPATDSETDAFTEGFWPSAVPGSIIITNEFGFTVDKKNGIKPKIRMKNYAGKIKMTISATYKDGAKTKKYKCTYAPFGSTKKAKTAKWKWYTPKKACVLPTPLVTAIKAGTTKLSAKGNWTRLWVTTGAKTRADKTKIKPRTLKYTVRAKPAAVK